MGLDAKLWKSVLYVYVFCEKYKPLGMPSKKCVDKKSVFNINDTIISCIVLFKNTSGAMGPSSHGNAERK